MIPPKVKLFCHRTLLYPLRVPTLAIALPAPIPPANHAARSSLPPSPPFLSFFESSLSDLSPRTLHLPSASFPIRSIHHKKPHGRDGEGEPGEEAGDGRRGRLGRRRRKAALWWSATGPAGAWRPPPSPSLPLDVCPPDPQPLHAATSSFPPRCAPGLGGRGVGGHVGDTCDDLAEPGPADPAVAEEGVEPPRRLEVGIADPHPCRPCRRIGDAQGRPPQSRLSLTCPTVPWRHSSQAPNCPTITTPASLACLRPSRRHRGEGGAQSSEDAGATPATWPPFTLASQVCSVQIHGFSQFASHSSHAHQVLVLLSKPSL